MLVFALDKNQTLLLCSVLHCPSVPGVHCSGVSQGRFAREVERDQSWDQGSENCGGAPGWRRADGGLLGWDEVKIVRLQVWASSEAAWNAGKVYQI